MSYKAKIIISEQVMNDGNSINQRRTAVINPSMKFRVPFIPGALTFAISIITSGLDYTKDFTFSLKVFNKNNEEEVVFETENERIPGSNSAYNVDNFGFDFSLSNQKFLSEGTYVVLFSVDGEKSIREEFDIIADEVLEFKRD